MGGQSLRRRPTVRIVATAALTCGLLGGLVAAPAAADQADVDRVTTQVAALQMESAKAGEKANGARVALSRSLDRLALFRRQATRARIELARQQRGLQQLARELYVNGGFHEAVLAFTLDDPAGFLARLDQLSTATASQSGVLNSARASAVKLQKAQGAVDRETVRLKKAANEMRMQNEAARQKVADAQALLGRLKQAERVRLETLRRQQLAASITVADGMLDGSGSYNQSELLTLLNPPANASEAVQRVIAYALAQVGKPYVWGAPGPDSFDCSGLTRAAWAQAGVALTHYSGSQYSETTPVPLASIQPGDLLYFYSIEQHVGLYIGNGKLVQAANPGAGVIVSDLAGYWQSNLVAASRPSVG